MSGHPDPHTLALWAGGDLDPVATDHLVPHVDTCAECRQTLEELERAQALLREAFAEPSEVDLQRVHCALAKRLEAQRRTRRWCWSVGIVVACLMLLFVGVEQRKTPTAPERALQLPPSHDRMHFALNIPEVKRLERSPRRRPTHSPEDAGLRTVNFVARADGTTQFRVTTADPNVVILLSPLERTVEQ